MHGQVSRIKRNSLFYFFSTATRLTANILLFIGIARWYGPEILGSFSSAFAMSAIFIVLADFGFDILLTTEVAKKRRALHHLISQYFSIKFVFSLAAMLLMWLIPILSEINRTTATLTIIMSFCVIFTTMSNFFFALFKGLEQFEHEMKIVFVSNSFLIITLTGVIFLKLDVLMLGVAFILSRALALTLAIRKANQLVGLKNITVTLRNWSADWRVILTFGLSVIFGNFLVLVVTPLLLFLQNEYAVGIYESVFKIIGVTLIIPEIGINTMLPTLSRLHAESKERWIEMSRIFNKTLFFFSLPIVLCLFVIPEYIIDVVYGLEEYSDAVQIMQIASFVVLVRFSVETFALMLTTSDRQIIRMIITATGTGIIIALCFILIPLYGILGAALSSLFVNVLIGGGYIVAMRPYSLIWIFGKDIIVPSLVTLISGLYLINLPTEARLLMIIPLLLFHGLLYYFVGYSKRERKLVFSYKI